MSKRTKLIIVAVVVAVLAAAVFLLFGKKAPAPKAEAPKEEAAPVGTLPPVSTLPQTTITNVSLPGEAPPPEVSAQAAVVRLSASFAERYGSYSNQGNFENLRDLFPLMTDRLKSATERLIVETQKTRDPSAAYFGVTTKAISSNVETFNEEAGTAKIIVSTQRAETRGVGEPVVSYQDLVLELARVGKEWRFDRASWK